MTLDLPPDVSPDDADILRTDAGRPFVRTPDECFADLPDHPWAPNFADVGAAIDHARVAKPGHQRPL